MNRFAVNRAGWTAGDVHVVDGAGHLIGPRPGWVRGAFGIYTGIVGVDGGAAEAFVASLTHTPTGTAVYIFTMPDDAAEAAEIIEGLADWSALVDLADAATPSWRDVGSRCNAAIAAAGFRRTPIYIRGRPLLARPINAAPPAPVARN